ncbi:STAS domain-containing protein [Micromonospora sp. NPDC007271]|uniref:STAS domain-containing protein n=1 Tax=Micromonospora sp. NPDC007271 TaxID=3154587 RepID=UPI0033FB74DE
MAGGTATPGAPTERGVRRMFMPGRPVRRTEFIWSAMSFAAAGGPIRVAASRISFVVRAAVTRADIPILCAELAELLRGRGPGIVSCDVGGVHRPDLVTVEALARLRLTARRHGRQLVIRGADPGLLRLVGLLGLADALPESSRQTEQREEAGGVEEVGDRRDPPGG